MKDIEKFINDHREAFDSYEPGERVWKNLEAAFPEVKPNKAKTTSMLWLRWSAAASVILFLGAGFYYFSQKQETYKQVAIVEHAAIPDEYAEEVYHFTRLIEIKHKELKKIRKEEPELYEKFSTDIIRLDSSYQMLKKQLPGNPNDEQVLAAMIENLRIQIDLLNEQLNIIHKIKQNKNRDNEKQYKST